MSARATPDQLPAWSLGAADRESIAIRPDWPRPLTREWAWGGASGEGARVCLIDSGVDGEHPDVAPLADSLVASGEESGRTSVAPDPIGDVSGHGTACAGVIRSLAPDCELTSVRVLGEGSQGAGVDLIAGLAWAAEQGFDVINLSLSTTRRRFAEALYEVADRAYFAGTAIVASAHNMPVESWPWRLAAVISVGSHEGTDPWEFLCNPEPPVEFFARGVGVEVPWPGGERLTATGNSFATPHIAAIAALIRSKHPELTPFELKTVLRLTASNAEHASGSGQDRA